MSFYTKHVDGFANRLYSDALKSNYQGGFAQMTRGQALGVYGAIGGTALGLTGAAVGYGIGDYEVPGVLTGTALGAGLGAGVAAHYKGISNNLFRGMKHYGENTGALTGAEIAAKGKSLNKSFWQGLGEVYPL